MTFTTNKDRYRWFIHLEWKVQDCWIGLFWRVDKERFDLWFCLLPCIPIHITRIGFGFFKM